MIKNRLIVPLLAVILLLVISGCNVSPSHEPVEPEQTIVESETPSTETGALPGTSAPQRQALTVLFFSDTQADPVTGDYSVFKRLLEGAVSRIETPDLIIFGGDTVNDGGDEAEWQEFRKAAAGCLDGSTTAAVAGNHDNYPLLADQFDYPVRGAYGQSSGYFYTISIGAVFFIMLDSNNMGAANQSDIDWLRQELRSEAAKDADYIIAVMHHPMWTVSDNPKDVQRAKTMRENFLPLLEDSGVALILCGHQHIYARTQPMSGDAVSSGRRGIVQVMAASGDKATYSAGESDYSVMTMPAPNYLLIVVDYEGIVITAFDSDHGVIDKVRI